MLHIYSYRYMWQLEGFDTIHFKVVTDTSKGLSEFEEALLKLPRLKSAAKEYIQEYDCSLVGTFTKLFEKEVNNEKV